MQAKDLFAQRKSVRSYLDKPVDPEKLAAVLEAAQRSPMGMARYDGVHLTVIEDPKMIAKISQTAQEAFDSPKRDYLFHAPCFILVSAKGQGETLLNIDYSNAAILVHSMGLAAVDQGLGQCYIWGAVRALVKKPELWKELGIPQGFTPCCGLTLGESEVAYEERPRKEKISVNYLR